MKTYQNASAIVFLILVIATLTAASLGNRYFSEKFLSVIFDVGVFCLMALNGYIISASRRGGEKIWSLRWALCLFYNFICWTPALMIALFTGGLLAYSLHLYSPLYSMTGGLIVGSIIWPPMSKMSQARKEK